MESYMRLYIKYNLPPAGATLRGKGEGLVSIFNLCFIFCVVYAAR